MAFSAKREIPMYFNLEKIGIETQVNFRVFVCKVVVFEMHLRSPSDAPFGSHLDSGGSRLMDRIETTDETNSHPANPLKPVEDPHNWRSNNEIGSRRLSR